MNCLDEDRDPFFRVHAAHDPNDRVGRRLRQFGTQGWVWATRTEHVGVNPRQDDRQAADRSDDRRLGRLGVDDCCVGQQRAGCEHEPAEPGPDDVVDVEHRAAACPQSCERDVEIGTKRVRMQDVEAVGQAGEVPSIGHRGRRLVG